MRDIVSLKIVYTLKVQRRYWRMNTYTPSEVETTLKYKRNEIITFIVENSHEREYFLNMLPHHYMILLPKMSISQ